MFWQEGRGREDFRFPKMYKYFCRLREIFVKAGRSENVGLREIFVKTGRSENVGLCFFKHRNFVMCHRMLMNMLTLISWRL